MTDCTNVTNICVSSKNLSKLFLRNCNTISDETVKNISQTCPNIKFLEIFNCLGVKYPYINCTELTDLHISRCDNLVKTTIDCTKLKNIAFLSCKNLNQLEFKTETASNTELLFGECSLINDKLFKNLEGAKNIQTLIFNRCPSIQNPRINLSQLKNLKFSECSNLKQPMFQNTKLNSISFHECNKLDYQRTSEMNCEQIESMEISECQTFSKIHIDSDVRKLSIVFCNNLKELYLLNNTIVKSKVTSCPSLVVFGSYAQNLKEISLKECNEISSFLLKNPENIKQVELLNCNRISDMYITFILFKCINLKQFTISSCGLSSPVLKHDKLNGLEITKCTQLEKLIVDCPQMKELNLSDCPKLSTFKIENYKNLEKLNVVNIPYQGDAILNIVSKLNTSFVHLKNIGLSYQDKKLLSQKGINVF